MYSGVRNVCSYCSERLLLCFIVSVISIWTQHTVKGQGRMMMPPGRSSMWRFGYDTPVNHNDNVLNCGGTLYRYTKAEGKCGTCGDAWGPKPRDNEAGGTYAMGIITAVYNPGSTIDIVIDDVVANGGYFEFRLCDNSNFSVPDSEECFQNGLLTIKNTLDNKFRDIKNGENKLQLILPDKVTCEQCVIRWKYRTAEHYGCENSKGKEKCCFGCGEIQNEYYACADIAIVNGDTNSYMAANGGYDMAQENINVQALKRKKRSPFRRLGMQEGIQVISMGPPTPSVRLPYTSLLNRGTRRNSLLNRNSAPQGNTKWNWGGGPVTNTGTSRNSFGNGISSNSRRVTGIPTLNGGQSIGSGIGSASRRNTFNGNNPPVRSMIRVDRPVIRTPINRNGRRDSRTSIPSLWDRDGRPPFISPISPTADALMIRPIIDDPFARYRNQDACKAIGPFKTKEMDEWCRSQCSGGNCVINECSCNGKRYPKNSCDQCPYGKCITDQSTELNSIYPGIFNNYTTFLECGSYDKIYGLGTYKVLAEGLPECSHPRFKRQITVPLEEEGYGCCGTRPQVIMPLSVKAENISYNVVQLPEDRNQFLVRGVCGRNSTVSCPMCVPEYNFQWVLVYDAKLKSNPPVNFVPVKFAHYCRCINPGYNLGK